MCILYIISMVTVYLYLVCYVLWFFLWDTVPEINYLILAYYCIAVAKIQITNHFVPYTDWPLTIPTASLYQFYLDVVNYCQTLLNNIIHVSNIRTYLCLSVMYSMVPGGRVCGLRVLLTAIVTRFA